jgi:hypothetical protein
MADAKISALPASTTPLAGTEVLPIVQSSVTKKVATDDLTVKNVRSNATNGILQVTGPASASTRVMTTPDANFTAARTDAGQTFTGVNTFTSPKIITDINDTNGNELIKITATASAVNELTVANAATGNNPVISATGSDTNIGITLTPKGTGNAVLTTGNLVIGTAGKGIDFSADGQAAGMTSELLDDYEEGTWTPTLGGDATYTFQAGTYTKVGRLVIANCILKVNIIGTGATNNVSGLPFTVRSQTQGFGGTPQYFENLANNVVVLNPSPNTGATIITFYTLAAAGGTTSYNTALWQNSARIDFTVMYFT